MVMMLFNVTKMMIKNNSTDAYDLYKLGLIGLIQGIHEHDEWVARNGLATPGSMT